MSQTKQVTAETFESQVLRSEVPVLVDFFATWCAPCRTMAPVLDRVATQVSGRAKVVKVDIDEDPGLASLFNVASIPTLVLFSNGKAAARTVGVSRAEQLVEMIDKESAPARATAR